MKQIADWLIKTRTIITPITLMIFFLLIYKFLPNRRTNLERQIPGAVFAAIGWMIISWIFSVYVDVFQGFSDMYGSLTYNRVDYALDVFLYVYDVLLGARL